MKAFTVYRPWSFAIAHLGKDVENRPKPTKYRGLVAIHGGKKWSDDGAMCIFRVIRDWPLETAQGIVAVAEIIDCHEAGPGCCESPWAMPDRFHWQLANVRPLPDPVPCKGFLSLWTVPAEVERAVWKALETA